MPASPEWLQALGAMPMYLGLDLRGGVHFLLQVDMEAALNKAASATSATSRSLLRDKQDPLLPASRATASAIEVRFRDADQRDAALKVMLPTSCPTCSPRDGRGGELRARRRPSSPRRASAIQELALQQNITTLRNRVNELGVAEPIIQQQGADRIVVQLPGVQDTAKAKDILGRTATLEVRMVDEEQPRPAADARPVRAQAPFGADKFLERERRSRSLVKKQVVLTGDRITDAAAGLRQHQTGQRGGAP